MDNRESRITGSTKVRGVALTLEELGATGSHRLTWQGDAIAGSVEFDGGPEETSRIWSEAIGELRADQTRDPIEQPEMAEPGF